MEYDEALYSLVYDSARRDGFKSLQRSGLARRQWAGLCSHFAICARLRPHTEVGYSHVEVF
jgi:hypothetical protein